MPFERFEGFEIVDHSRVPLPPRAKVPAPGLAIKLANRSLKAAYKGNFGREIPVLTENDVRIVNRQDFPLYVDAAAQRVYHSHAIAYQEARDLHSGRPANPVYASLVTIWGRSGMPVLIFKDYLNRLSQHGELAASEILAFMLIHEGLHRTPARLCTLPDLGNLLYEKVALSTRLHEIELADENSQRDKDFLLERLRIIDGYARPRPKFLQSNGAMTQLYCLDEDSRMRKLLDNGYDLNEGVVELLSQKPRQFLMEEVRKRHNREQAEAIVRAFENAQGRDSSVYITRLTPRFTADYCSRLGLENTDSILQAHLAGNFASLHIQHLPDELYPS